MSGNPKVQVEMLLLESRAVLLREHKHKVYRLGNGATFVCSKTASDHRAFANQVRDLKRLMLQPAKAQWTS